MHVHIVYYVFLNERYFACLLACLLIFEDGNIILTLAIDLIWPLTILRQQKLIDSSRIGACFGCLNLPILRQRKYAHIRLEAMPRFKVHYTKRLYQDHLLPPINVITEELSNQKHQPDSYTKNDAGKKKIKFVKKFAENFK